MPFNPGERIDWIPITSSHPEHAVFQLTDEHGQAVIPPLTVANGGLEQRRKDAVHPVFHAPYRPGKYAYRFTDGTQVVSGHVRVMAQPTVKPQPAAAEQAQQGVRARRL